MKYLLPALLLVALGLPGLQARQADPIDAIVAKEMAAQRIPGVAVAVVRNGEVIKAQGYGLAGRYAFSAVVPPGPYTLRVGAIDQLGRQGSVERPFDARMTVAEGVRVSDLILAPLPAKAGDPLEPLIDRVSGSTVMAYLEMHAADRGRLPDAVRIVISRLPSGSALVTVPADMALRDGGWAIARAVVPTVDLQPGPYVARAEVVANGRTIARVARPFTIADR